MIYLDNAATTIISDEVLDSMMPFMKNLYYNPGGLYPGGVCVKNAIDEARRYVANLINCDPDDIIFTSGGSESNNLVVKGSKLYNLSRCKSLILTSDIEHDSLIESAEEQYKQSVVKLDICKDGTAVCSDKYYKKYPNKIGLTSVMYVNNETGAVNDVDSFCNIAHKNDSLFHMDCVQASSCAIIDVEKVGCDFASISSHKLHGPKGVGALFIRNELHENINPLINGGAAQEFGLRGGTENVAGIVGFGAACRLTKNRISEDIVNCDNLHHAFVDEIKHAFYNKHAGDLLSFNGNNNGKICSMTIKGVDSQTLCMLLGANGVYVSPGSACRTTRTEPSRVLTAMGLSDAEAHSTIRVSFSRYNTIEEVKEAANIIYKVVKEYMNE